MNTDLSHRSLNQLIPWYVNGTLSPEECIAFEQHLEHCAQCQTEVTWMRQVGVAITELADEAPAANPSFEKLMTAVERWERSKEPARSRWFFSVWEGFTEIASSWWRVTPLLPRAIIAIQAILVVGLAGTMIYEQHKDKTYITSSAPSGDGSTTRIVVGFNDSASEQQIKQVILAVHGKFVDGPSALGLYTIQVPITGQRSAEIQEVLDALRRNDGVVRFAELTP